MGELAKYAQENSKFLRVPAGAKIKAKYLGHKIVQSRWDEDETTVRYFFDVDGTEKQMESKSLKLAELLDTIEVGEEIEISREGEGAQTSWKVKKTTDTEEEAEPLPFDEEQ